MKMMIMTDMEGVAGVLNFEDWVVPGGRFYEKGMRFLTEEVNAAVDGFFEGGATEVQVVDGHGAGGIDPELLDERAWLMRGLGEKAYPCGLDGSFDGLAFVGQHAKAGTPYSHITHTQWFNHIDLAVNGLSIGEYGQVALCAMELGVPTVLACGEEAFAREAEALTPGVVTVSVKRGLLPDGLDPLDTDAYARAKLSAIHVSPRRAKKLIREGALEAVRRLEEGPSFFLYPEMVPPYVRTARFRRSGDTPPYSTRDEHPDSIIELMNMPFTKSG
jgi:D-amino peptidase